MNELRASLPAKDPAAVLPYVFDWTAYLLDLGESIATYEVGADNVVLESHSRAGNEVTVVLSGGSEFGVAEAYCKIVTSSGVTDKRAILIPIRSR